MSIILYVEHYLFNDHFHKNYVSCIEFVVEAGATAMCIDYQLHPRTGVLFYVTDVVIPPITFTIGIAGNLLILIILSRRSMRRDSAMYVYYTAIAAVDLVALLSAMPSFVRHIDLVPLSFAHSRWMAYVVWARRAVEPMLRHTAGWLTAAAAGVRCATVRLDTVAGSPAQWTQISASRIVAFVIFVACVLLDFTRFLDAAVVELTDHCFTGVRLWSHNVTSLGRRRFYVELQPAASTLVGETLPFGLSLLFAIILFVGHLHCCRRTPSVALRTPLNSDEHGYQLSATVFALSIAFVILDAPSAALGLTRIFYFRSSNATGNEYLYRLSLIAGCLSLLRCAVNCLLLVVVNYDFRKTMRRTFCCCSPSDDDVYFEPVMCCPPPCYRRSQDHTDYERPKRISWNQLDYIATTDVIARESPTRDGGQFHQMTLLQTDQQLQDFDSSFWV